MNHPTTIEPTSLSVRRRALRSTKLFESPSVLSDARGFLCAVPCRKPDASVAARLHKAIPGDEWHGGSRAHVGRNAVDGTLKRAQVSFPARRPQFAKRFSFGLFVQLGGMFWDKDRSPSERGKAKPHAFRWCSVV